MKVYGYWSNSWNSGPHIWCPNTDALSGYLEDGVKTDYKLQEVDIEVYQAGDFRHYWFRKCTSKDTRVVVRIQLHKEEHSVGAYFGQPEKILDTGDVSWWLLKKNESLLVTRPERKNLVLMNICGTLKECEVSDYLHFYLIRWLTDQKKELVEEELKLAKERGHDELVAILQHGPGTVTKI